MINYEFNLALELPASTNELILTTPDDTGMFSLQFSGEELPLKWKPNKEFVGGLVWFLPPFHRHTDIPFSGFKIQWSNTHSTFRGGISNYTSEILDKARFRQFRDKWATPHDIPEC